MTGSIGREGVDVLAVGVVTAIDNCAFYLREEVGLTQAAEQMEAVSAAVAELIEVANASREHLRALNVKADGAQKSNTQASFYIAKLDAALARCEPQP